MIVKANTNADNPNTRAVLFHLGKFIPTGVPDTYGFNGIDDSATTGDTVALKYSDGIEGLDSVVKFRWNGNGVELIGNTPADAVARSRRTQARRGRRCSDLSVRDMCSQAIRERKASPGRSATPSAGCRPGWRCHIQWQRVRRPRARRARVIYSASDLAAAARCEYALLRSFDAQLGRGPPVAVEDELLARTAKLGDEHEQRHLDELRDAADDNVAVIGRPAYTVAGLTAAAEATSAPSSAAHR